MGFCCILSWPILSCYELQWCDSSLVLMHICWWPAHLCHAVFMIDAHVWSFRCSLVQVLWSCCRAKCLTRNEHQRWQPQVSLHTLSCISHVCLCIFCAYYVCMCTVMHITCACVFFVHTMSACVGVEQCARCQVVEDIWECAFATRLSVSVHDKVPTITAWMHDRHWHSSRYDQYDQYDSIEVRLFMNATNNVHVTWYVCLYVHMWTGQLEARERLLGEMEGTAKRAQMVVSEKQSMAMQACIHVCNHRTIWHE